MGDGNMVWQENDPLTKEVIGCAIEVHKELGPGLLESVYEECLVYELKMTGMKFERQVKLPVKYKSIDLECGIRMDVVMPGNLVIELKTVEKILPVHLAQVLTYLRFSGIRTGLIINFFTPRLINGIKRIVL